MSHPTQKKIFVWLSGMTVVLVVSCDLSTIQKRFSTDTSRKPLARVNNTYLYLDEIQDSVPIDSFPQDSADWVNSYINSWIRKQLLITEAIKKIDINKSEVERKVLDYRYSLIGYEFQNFYIHMYLNDSVSFEEIETYYKKHHDNFILKQNIVKCRYIKLPQTAPHIARVKKLLFTTNPKKQSELTSYCLRYSVAFHLSDSTWVEFDKLVADSPLSNIPNKIDFLRNYRFYETRDAGFLYFLKINSYKITDNTSPIEFVKDDIKEIILNKRKVELAKRMEDEIYENAIKQKDFEIFNY